MDCVEGKCKINMRFVAQKQNVRRVYVFSLLALAEFRRDSGVIIYSEEMYIYRVHTKQRA